MARLYVEPSPRNVHGNFSREHEPILTIDSGDTVVFRTLDASWQVKARTSLSEAPEYMPADPSDKKRGNGHCLCGPIAINGAKAGMTLEIEIGEILCGSWGWTGSGGWPHWIHQKLGTDKVESKFLWALDSSTGVGRNQHGHEVRLRPFMGVMGMPPDEPGTHLTAPPRVVGGNLDCKELVTGTRLYLPIAVDTALFSVGDGHARQGDGEVCVTAIECPMDRVELTFHLHPSMKISAPRARIADAWLTMGLDEDLDEACVQAVSGMIDLMVELHPELDRETCLALASVVVDLHVTQIVNGTKGVHAILRDDAIRYPAVAK